MEARVDKNGNTLTILRNDYSTLYIDLNDRMVDLDKPVVIIRDGRTIFDRKVPRRAEYIATSVEERTDPDYIFSARLEITAAGVKAL